MNRSRHRDIAILLAFFFILGFLYSIVTPPFEASDEIFHYPVVEHLADGKGLPIQDPSMETAWRQEGSQPPLYYSLMAALTFWIDTDDLSQRLWYNPHAQIGIPLAHGNKNMVVHTDADRYPFRGSVLAVYLIRWLSLLLQAVTVVFVYLIAREVSKDDRAIALLATALVAFNPMFLFISASVNNDNLVVPIATVTVWLLLTIIGRGFTWPRILALGLLCALASLAKVSGLALVGLSSVALVVAARKERKWTWLWRGVVTIAASVVIVAGWWYFRNWRLYGDPLGISMMLEIVGRRAQQADLATLASEFEGFRISFWGLFGGVNVLAREWVYVLFDTLSIGAIVGWGYLLLQKRVLPLATRNAWLLALWLVIVTGSLVRWTMMTLASQGRLLFPAIAAVSTLMAIGVLGWARGSVRWPVSVFLAAAVFIAAATTPFTSIAPAYKPSPVLAEDALPSDIKPVQANFDGKMMLLGYNVTPRSVSEGDTLWVTAYWKVLAPMADDYSVYVHVFDQDMQKYGALDTYTGLGTRPTSLLRPGDVIADRYAVTIEQPVAAPNACEVEIGLYHLPTMKSLTAVDPQGQTASRVLLLGAKLVPSPWPATNPTITASIDFADEVSLIGFDLEPETALPGEDVNLTLYWQAKARLAEDLTVFVHLADEDGTVVAQADSRPASGAYPTDLWDAGEIIADSHVVHVPSDTPPGEYPLVVGLYRPDDGRRVAATDEQGNAVPDGAATLPVPITVVSEG